MGHRGAAWLSIAAAGAMVMGGASIGVARSAVMRVCGAAWTAAPQPAISGSGGLEDVAATSSTDAWAVGHRFDPTDQTTHPLIEHHDGTSWTLAASMEDPSMVQSLLLGVDARTTTDAWAVGYGFGSNNLARTLVERWDGSVWTRVVSPNAGHPANGELSGVVALAADDAWAVGAYGDGGPSRTLIEHWDGTAWTTVPSPNKGPFPNSLSSVAAVSPDDVWVVGTWFTKAFDDRTLTLHWDGTSWHRVKSPNAGPTSAANDLVSVSAVATDDVWAVGVRGLHTLTLHWDGAAWSVVGSPTPGGNADLGGVVAVDADDVWAVGGFVDRDANAVRTLVEHWDGAGWTVVESANKGTSDNHLWGISAVTGRMLAVGERFKGGGTGPVVPLSLERCSP
ncbi:MAG: hypothetical protein ACXWEG_10715 [Actinomycetota bacterium]